MTLELKSVDRPHLDTIDVVRFAKAADGETPAPIATIDGAVGITPGRRYMLMVITTGITFKLSVGGTGAAIAGDMDWPINTPFIFDSGEFNTFHADGTTGKLLELSQV